MKLGRSGFTLLEVMIALAMVIPLILFVMSQNASFIRQQMYSITHSDLAQDSVLEANYFKQALENSGGGAVRSWMSVWVDNGCPTRTGLPDCLPLSDRLTIMTSNATPLDCIIKSQAATNAIILADATCNANNLFLPLGGGATGQGVQLMLVLNNLYSQVYVTGYNPGTLTVTYAPGQAAANDPLGIPSPPAWGGGTMSVVTVNTFYVSPTGNQLMYFQDLDHNGPATASNASVLANNIFDLQAALGVDLLGNGNIVDTLSNTDQWLFNAPGDLPYPFPSYQPNQIAMIEVGLITGVPHKYNVSNASSTVQILDGPDRQAAVATQYDLKAIMFKVAPRNN